MPLIRVAFIPLPPGKQPGFDHADLYRGQSPEASRLYVAHTGADRIDIIDCPTNSYLGSLADAPGVAGVLIDSEQDFLSHPIVAVPGRASTAALTRRCSAGLESVIALMGWPMTRPDIISSCLISVIRRALAARHPWSPLTRCG